MGLITVLTCYVLWGTLSIFWNLLSGVDSLYILAQRIFWSMIFMGGYLAVTGRTGEVKGVLKDKRAFRQCFISGVLVTINWGVYTMIGSMDTFWMPAWDISLSRSSLV